MASLPSIVSTAPLSLLSSANVLRVHSILSPMSLIKMLKSTGPKTVPWGTLLFTGLHLDIEPSITTLRLQPFNQFLVHWVIHPSKPHLSNLDIKRWLDRVKGLAQTGELQTFMQNFAWGLTRAEQRSTIASLTPPAILF